tara:strand:- start:236 stop:463 length:228 start_codon:yes stop_codon:yes gene_type:complete
MTIDQLIKTKKLDIGTDSAPVQNRFTGESVTLSPEEIAVYDLAIGAEYMGDYALMNKAREWFIKNNPSAYMVLLD